MLWQSFCSLSVSKSVCLVMGLSLAKGCVPHQSLWFHIPNICHRTLKCVINDESLLVNDYRLPARFWAQNSQVSFKFFKININLAFPGKALGPLPSTSGANKVAQGRTLKTTALNSFKGLFGSTVLQLHFLYRFTGFALDCIPSKSSLLLWPNLT